MSLEYRTAAWGVPGLTPAQKLMLVKICDFASEDGFSWPRVSTLAEIVNVSERSIQRAKSELIQMGLIRVHERRGEERRPDVLWIDLEALKQAAETPPTNCHPVTNCHHPGDTSVTPPPDTSVTPNKGRTVTKEPSSEERDARAEEFRQYRQDVHDAIVAVVGMVPWGFKHQMGMDTADIFSRWYLAKRKPPDIAESLQALIAKKGPPKHPAALDQWMSEPTRPPARPVGAPTEERPFG